MEKKRLLITSISKNDNKKVQRMTILFVDDGDFCSSGVESKSKMQEIADFCETMHEATGGKLQKEKFIMHSWKCKTNNAI